MLAQETLTLAMPLTSQERNELSRCEGFIERNLQTLFEVGKAFAQIRDAKLYRETHKTFEEYCVERWKISRPRAYQLIDASVVQENLSTNVDKALPLPTNESQTRALKHVPDEKQPELWTKAVERNNGRAPTGRQIVQVIETEFEEKKPKFVISKPLANVSIEINGNTARISPLPEKDESDWPTCCFCGVGYKPEKLYYDWKRRYTICRQCAAKAQIALLHPDDPEVIAECQQIEQFLTEGCNHASTHASTTRTRRLSPEKDAAATL